MGAYIHMCEVGRGGDHFHFQPLLSRHLSINTNFQLHIDFVFDRFTPHNVLGIRQFADTLGCMMLVEAADKYVQQYFHDVSLSEEYLALNSPELLDIVKRDELHVLSEEQVYSGS